MKENRDCAVVQDLLPLYIDGICSEESTQLMTEHLATCDACRTVHADMQAQIPTPAAESEMTTRMAWRQLVRSFRRKNIRHVLIALAVAVALFITGTLAYDRLFRVAREPIAAEETYFSLSPQPDGELLIQVSRKDGRTIPRTQATFDEASGILYYQLLRPLVEWGARGPEVASATVYLSDALWEIDGVLYKGTPLATGEVPDSGWTQEASVVREIRLGDPDGYATIYQEGDSLA